MAQAHDAVGDKSPRESNRFYDMLKPKKVTIKKVGGQQMEKQTKNIITRDWVEKELRFYNTADIKHSIFLFIIYTLVFLPITIAMLHGGGSSIKNTFLRIVLAIFLGGVMSSPIWISCFWILNALLERKMLMRGEFDIVTRELLCKSEKRVCRQLKEFLHFQDFRKKHVGHTTFQLASNGDIFYIVHYKTKKSIKLMYPAKMHEYK